MLLMIEQNALRLKDKIFKVRGTIRMISSTTGQSDVIIYFRTNSSNFRCDIPIARTREFINIFPGDIITLSGKYHNPSLVDLLKDCTLLQIEKQVESPTNNDIKNSNDFFRLIGNSFLWANGKRFTVRIKVSKIDEYNRWPCLYAEGDNNFSQFLLFLMKTGGSRN